MNNLSSTIESILFATAESHSVASLAKLLTVDVAEIETALTVLATSFEGHAMMLVRTGDTVTLATRPEHAALLEQLRKEELQKDLSKASAETLAVIIYRPGTTKAEIELIRGVNASYSLRVLQIRGLIETKSTGRSVAYYPTVQLLEHFGVADIAQLPEYEATKEKIARLLEQTAE